MSGILSVSFFFFAVHLVVVCVPVNLLIYVRVMIYLKNKEKKIK